MGLTNELANGALAFFTVTGEMWHHKITSNPRLTRAVTAASNCYLSHLGAKLGLDTLLLWCLFMVGKKTVRLIITDARKITLILIIIMYVSRNGRILLILDSSNGGTTVNCCHPLVKHGTTAGPDAALKGSRCPGNTGGA